MEMALRGAEQPAVQNPLLRHAVTETHRAKSDVVAVYMDKQAGWFVALHGLGTQIQQVQERLSDAALTGAPIRAVRLTVDEDWEEDASPRLLATVEFDADLVWAYDKWKEMRSTIIEVSAGAEDEDLVAFALDSRE
jgi:hypothetical protein